MSSHSHRQKHAERRQSESEDDDYIRRSDAANKKYGAVYAAWLESQSPAELEKIRKLGLDEPLNNFHRVSGHSPDQDRDAAESSRSVTQFAARDLDPEPAPANSAIHLDPHVMLTVQRIVGMIISHDNVKISTAGLAFALNMDGLNGLGSIREYAARIGVSPEAVSKAKRSWQKELDLPPNAFAKTDKAKNALSVAQLTKHWKKRRWQAPLSPSHTA